MAHLLIKSKVLWFSFQKAQAYQSKYSNEKDWKTFTFHWILCVYFCLMTSPNPVSTLTDSGYISELWGGWWKAVVSFFPPVMKTVNYSLGLLRQVFPFDCWHCPYLFRRVNSDKTTASERLSNKPPQTGGNVFFPPLSLRFLLIIRFQIYPGNYALQGGMRDAT